jgi:hypothetical protein
MIQLSSTHARRTDDGRHGGYVQQIAVGIEYAVAFPVADHRRIDLYPPFVMASRTFPLVGHYDKPRLSNDDLRRHSCRVNICLFAGAKGRSISALLRHGHWRTLNSVGSFVRAIRQQSALCSADVACSTHVF